MEFSCKLLEYFKEKPAQFSTNQQEHLLVTTVEYLLNIFNFNTRKLCVRYVNNN